MRSVEIRIIQDDKNVRLGVGSVIESINGISTSIFNFCTLELPYKNNQRRISSIQRGRYQVKKRYSAKYGYHFELLNVPDRDKILIHVANFVRELLGCIAVGKAHKHIDNDGILDLTESAKTLKKLNELMPNQFELMIK